jgi:hypothetical protein
MTAEHQADVSNLCRAISKIRRCGFSALTERRYSSRVVIRAVTHKIRFVSIVIPSRVEESLEVL